MKLKSRKRNRDVILADSSFLCSAAASDEDVALRLTRSRHPTVLRTLTPFKIYCFRICRIFSLGVEVGLLFVRVQVQTRHLQLNRRCDIIGALYVFTRWGGKYLQVVFFFLLPLWRFNFSPWTQWCHSVLQDAVMSQWTSGRCDVTVYFRTLWRHCRLWLQVQHWQTVQTSGYFLKGNKSIKKRTSTRVKIKNLHRCPLNQCDSALLWLVGCVLHSTDASLKPHR